MAAAHLRMSMLVTHQFSMSERRESYARAVQGRASLGEHDRALLHALEPLLTWDPLDVHVAVARLREAAAKWPLDAELFATLASWEMDAEAGLRAAERAAELDPQYADALQTKGLRLAELGRFDETLATFDQCTRISPAALDCRMARAQLYGNRGRCAEMEED